MNTQEQLIQKAAEIIRNNRDTVDCTERIVLVIDKKNRV